MNTYNLIMPGTINGMQVVVEWDSHSFIINFTHYLLCRILQ